MEIKENLSDKGKRDLAIIQRALSGDQRAYGELMEIYQNSLYHTVNKMIKNEVDAEDVTIEAFGKAFNNLDQYVPDYAFSTWLFKIATNNCIDFLRKKRVEITSMDKGVASNSGEIIYIEAKSKGKTPEEEIIHQQKISIMRLAVSKLKPKHREILELRYFDELTYEEISQTLEISVNVVKVQLFRAREKLQEVMERGNTQDKI